MTKVVDHFIKEMYENEELILHTTVLKSDQVQTLEKRLRTGNPVAVAKFYENLPDAMDFEALKGFADEIEDIDREMLKSDDETVINFFSQEARKGTGENFLKISGVLVNLSHLSHELESNWDSIPRNVAVAALLWIYLNMYELSWIQ